MGSRVLIRGSQPLQQGICWLTCALSPYKVQAKQITRNLFGQAIYGIDTTPLLLIVVLFLLTVTILLTVTPWQWHWVCFWCSAYQVHYMTQVTAWMLLWISSVFGDGFWRMVIINGNCRGLLCRFTKTLLCGLHRLFIDFLYSEWNTGKVSTHFSSLLSHCHRRQRTEATKWYL